MSNLSDSREPSNNIASPTIDDTITITPLSDIVPDENQPRKLIDDKSIEELAESIKASGVINPILVREGQGGKYIIVSGERRFKASKKAGRKDIPARIVSGDYEILALAENLARKDLLAIEETVAVAKLFEKMKSDNAKAKSKELAAKLGIAESTMSEILKPSKLPDDIKKEASTSKYWSRFKLLTLAKIADTKKQHAAFEKMKTVIKAKIAAEAPAPVQTDQSGKSKDEIKKAKEAKTNEKKISVMKKHTTAFQDRIKKAIDGNWDIKDRKKITTDLKKIVDMINTFLDKPE